MKKYILIFSSLIFIATSCYKDLGSYDYRFDDMNDITGISFTPDAYKAIEGLTIELQQPLNEKETKRIEVKLDQTLSKDIENLDFTWIRTRTVEGKAVKDTVYTKGYYEVELEPATDIEYSIMLQIQDKTTTLSKYTKLLVKTRPIFKNSLFVLHGEKENAKLGNVEIIGNKDYVTEDVYKKIYPEEANPFNLGVGLTYNAFISFDRNNKLVYEHNLAIFNSNGAGSIYNPFGMKPKFSKNYLLPSADMPFIYNKSINVGTATSNTDYKCILSRDGRFYLGKTFLSFHKPAENVDKGMLNETDYIVKAATITEEHVVLWDSKNNRFLFVVASDSYGWSAEYAQYDALSKPVLNANVDLSVLDGALSIAGKEAIYAYIQYTENYSNAHPFFIFRDPTSKEFYLYELTPTKSTGGKDTKASFTNSVVTKGDDGKGDGKDDGKGDGKDDGKGDGKDDGNSSTEPAFTISGKLMEGFNPGTNISSIIYNSRFSTNYIFYANGNTVYRYDSSNGEIVPLYEAPAGYTVSVIKFRTWDSGTFVGDLPYYLSIGMNKGNEGAITEIKLTSSADLDKSYTPLFSKGFGNIIDIQFAHLYTYATVE